MYRLLPFSLVLALAACGGDEVSPTPQVAVVSEVAPEPSEGLAPASLIVEADYGDAMLAEGVPTASLVEASEPAESLDASSPQVSTFTLQRGETLAHFARWAETPVEDIADLSELPLDGQYPVGTEVKLALEADALEMFASLREEHKTRRVERYLASRGGTVGDALYRVRTGDSAWGIAAAEGGLPVWLIEAYNPSVDLERLRPGDELALPVLADVVVDAEDLD
ncbi:MAG: LysM peptidoglycan-binding domain-containing protein [Proteobacteria bacterium]|nr:LysM peptidoglycan-binding domain-containing protein [Pseudomonadota bacterium]